MLFGLLRHYPLKTDPVCLWRPALVCFLEIRRVLLNRRVVLRVAARALARRRETVFLRKFGLRLHVENHSRATMGAFRAGQTSGADFFGNPRPPKNVCPIAPGFGQRYRAGREALGTKAGRIQLTNEVILYNLIHRIQRAVDPACIQLV